MKPRKGQLGLDDEERPDEKHITHLGGTEVWYYQGPLPPRPPRSPCLQCGGDTYGPILFYDADQQYHQLCKQCGLVPPLIEKPEPLAQPRPNNQSTSTVMSERRQLELLPPPE